MNKCKHCGREVWPVGIFWRDETNLLSCDAPTSDRHEGEAA